jgi:hypothetical protein
MDTLSRLLLAVATVAAVVGPPPTPALARYGFPSAPTDQLVVPGQAAGTAVTPEGGLYNGWGELSYRVGPRLRPFRQPVRTLLDGRIPVVRAAVREGGVEYATEEFAAEAGAGAATYLRVTISNLGRRPARARFAAELRWSGGSARVDGGYESRFQRPAFASTPGLYYQPGEAFDPDAGYAFAGDALTRGGRAVYVFPRPSRGVRRALVLRPGGPAPVGPGTPFGRSDYTSTLPASRRITLDFILPMPPVAPGTELPSFPAARAATVARWRAVLGATMKVSLPERTVDDAFAAAILTDVGVRYRLADGQWTQPVNKFQYHSFWLRDAALITRMYDLVGLHDIAAENLRFFERWQQPDGLFVSRPGQYDGFGQALWAFGEHVLLSGDEAFGREIFPAVRRAMDWLIDQRDADPAGLMPDTYVSDNEHTAGRLAGDNFWAVAGVERAVALARRLGEDDLAVRWQAELAELRASLGAALDGATARTDGGAVPPALDRPGGEDFGNLALTYPTNALPAASATVAATLRRARASFREGLMTYSFGGRRLLHAPLSFRVWETQLARGDQAAVVRGLYDALAHGTSTLGGWELGNGRRVGMNMTPNGWWAAELVTLLRNMLVREEGDELVLLSAVPPAWLRGSRPLSVRGAPTLAGPVSFTLTPRPGGAELRWSAPPGTRVRWPVPVWVSGVRGAPLTADRRSIALASSSGRMTVRWTLRGGGAEPAYTRSVAVLRAKYGDDAGGRGGETLPGDA